MMLPSLALWFEPWMYLCYCLYIYKKELFFFVLRNVASKLSHFNNSLQDSGIICWMWWKASQWTKRMGYSLIHVLLTASRRGRTHGSQMIPLLLVTRCANIDNHVFFLYLRNYLHTCVLFPHTKLRVCLITYKCCGKVWFVKKRLDIVFGWHCKRKVCDLFLHCFPQFDPNQLHIRK